MWGHGRTLIIKLALDIKSFIKNEEFYLSLGLLLIFGFLKADLGNSQTDKRISFELDTGNLSIQGNGNSYIFRRFLFL